MSKMRKKRKIFLKTSEKPLTITLKSDIIKTVKKDLQIKKMKRGYKYGKLF